MQHKPSTDKFEAKRLGGVATQTQSIVTPSMQENWQRVTKASSVTLALAFSIMCCS